MALERKQDLGGDELGIDLGLRACLICRRELLPWQDTCPDDGGKGVLREELPPPGDPVLDRLLAEGDATGDGGDDTGEGEIEDDEPSNP